MSERLSAWMDGELAGARTKEFLTELKRNPNSRGDWARYHVIRDTLHGIHGPDLSSGILERIDSEPTVLVCQWRRSVERLGRFASTAGARVAAVSLASVVVLMTWQNLRQDAPEISAVSQPQVGRTIARADEGAKDYLLAHQTYSPSNRMQGLVMYVRAMSLANPSARRSGNPWKCEC